jgi:hypothetical protein
VLLDLLRWIKNEIESVLCVTKAVGFGDWLAGGLAAGVWAV